MARQIVKPRKQPKIKGMVSAAGLFKKAKVDAVKEKYLSRRETKPEPDLILDVQDGIESARITINAKAKSNFTEVHAAFLERLGTSRATDETFFKKVSESIENLSTPLAEEKIQTTFNRDGKRVTEVVEIGKRVTLFGNLINREDSKLKDYWKQWEALQDEYLELATEVFGPEVFEGNGDGQAQQRGFKWAMELLNLEHKARIQELGEEIMGVATETAQKMKVSEKELDSAAKKEQTRLLQALIQD